MIDKLIRNVSACTVRFESPWSFSMKNKAEPRLPTITSNMKTMNIFTYIKVGPNEGAGSVACLERGGISLETSSLC